ncbi:MAG: alpha-galactosidase, partial [Clostridiales bacterium]|nr:alpha-galactosidase [Clostridiales bacterium]
AGRTEKTEGAKTSVTLDFRAPDGKLTVTAECAVYRDYDAYEWTVWFANADQSNTAVLSDIWAADMKFAGANPVLKGNYGDHAATYTPFTRDLAQETAVLEGTSGRATQQWMPYFNIETDAGGVMAAIGWPGTWKAEFSRDGDAVRYLGAGTTGFAAYLEPGERARTPLMAFVRYFERDEDLATNKWRRWYIDCNMPYEEAGSAEKVQPMASVAFLSDTPKGWYTGGSEFEDSTTWRASYETVKAQGLKFDYHWFDAGWYVDSAGNSLPDSWAATGTWELDSKKWPGDTFKEYTSTMSEGLGTKSMLWFEPERINANPRALELNFGFKPQWLLPQMSGQYLADYTQSECVNWVFGRIKAAMEKCGISLYREDFNTNPVYAFRAGDALRGGAGREGITENLYYQGHFDLWDRVIAWCAETGRSTFIDVSASGGNRNDLETLRRAVPLFRSDSDITFNVPFALSKVNALNKWLPFGGLLFGRLSETNDTNPRDKYQWRAAYSTHIAVCLQFQKLTPETWELLRWGLEEFNRFKPYLYYDFYELTDWKPLFDKKQWVSRLYFDSASGKGAWQTFRLPDSPEARKKIVVRGVDPDKWYRLTDPDNLNGAARVKGSELLAGYDLYLPAARTASLIWIDPA